MRGCPPRQHRLAQVRRRAAGHLRRPSPVSSRLRRPRRHEPRRPDAPVGLVSRGTALHSCHRRRPPRCQAAEADSPQIALAVQRVECHLPESSAGGEDYGASRYRARRASAWVCLCDGDCLCLGACAPRAEWPDAGPDDVRRCRPQLRPRGAVDDAEGQQAGVRHQRDAALARHERSLLVLVSDPRRPSLLPGRSREEGEDSALRPREDGGGADDDYAHSLRCAEPAVQHRAVRQEGHGVRVQLPGAGHRGHPLHQAARDHDRAAGGNQGRRRSRGGGPPAADRSAGRSWSPGRRPR